MTEFLSKGTLTSYHLDSFDLNRITRMQKSYRCVLFCQGVRPFAQSSQSINQPRRVEMVLSIELEE